VRLIEECDREGKPLPVVPQPELPDLKPAPKIFKETCEIDFSKTATEIKNFVRGLSPYPGAWMMWNENVVKVFKAAISLVASAKGHIIVQCKDGYVDILELQAAGKKRMDTKAFLNGVR
jgi:methionyl-tRNA formyltransferase